MIDDTVQTVAERTVTMRSLGQLWYFSPANPTGHYLLDLADKVGMLMPRIPCYEECRRATTFHRFPTLDLPAYNLESRFGSGLLRVASPFAS